MSMPVFCLEMRCTDNWDDVRYREYTTSSRKAKAFKAIPRIQFTDSGHGIIPAVKDHMGRKDKLVSTVRDHVLCHLKVG